MSIFAAPVRKSATYTPTAAGGAHDVVLQPGQRYPFRLNFYNQPPVGDVSLEQFEEFAIARLRMIALIETSLIRNLPHNQLADLYKTASAKHLPLSSSTARKLDLQAERTRDAVGHFVLRLAFCGSEELRKRFVRCERELFRLRFESDDGEERKRFLESLQLGWEKLTDDDKKAHAAALTAVHGHQRDWRLDAETFYKVPWMDVPDLVGQRRVVVSAGFALVSDKDQLSLVLREFEQRLERALEQTAKYLPRLDEDSRLLPILSHLSLSYLSGSASSDYTFDGQPGNAEDRVTAAMVDGLARKHFPPCMRHLWEEGNAKHHLKHFARLQFGLFLKGIGLSIDEALLYWRRLFQVGSKMPEDKFKKEHVYNIRHSFGLEGGKKNYAPKSCQQILTQSQPGAQDTHGCPFRHFAPDRLSLFLSTNYALSGPDLQEVLGQVGKTHYHVACTRVFECSHGGAGGVKKGEGVGGGEAVDHPNKWFDRSWELEKLATGEPTAGAGAAADGVKPEPSS